MADYKQYGKKLIVSGCLSQRYSSELFDEMPEVDAFLGVNDYETLPALLDSLDERKIIANSCTETELPEVKVRADDSCGSSAVIKVLGTAKCINVYLHLNFPLVNFRLYCAAPLRS